MTVLGQDAESKEIRVIQLHEGNSDDIVYRIEKGTTLQFRLHPSLHGYVIKLFTNHPATPSDLFVRTKFQRVKWIIDRQNEETYANLTASIAGCYQYYIEKDGKRCGGGYFLVDPVLKVGKKNKVLKLDSISCQTVFPKSLGKLSEWKGRLNVTYQSGYNMIHFTPIQKLGGSNSSYSIADQLDLNPVFGTATFDDVNKIVDEIKSEWEVLSLCDVVFNHTANETPWLKTNPECGYNLVNSPHLRPAYILDALLHQLSFDVSTEKYADRGLPSKVSSEEHLNIIRSILKEELLPQVRIEELFLVNVEEHIEKFSKLLESTASFTGAQYDDDESKLVILQDPEYRRLKSTVDLNLGLRIYNRRWHDEDDIAVKSRAVNSLRQKLNQLNEGAQFIVNSHLTAAVENILSGIRYERLQPDGPKLPQVTAKDPLIHRYFEKVGLPSCQELGEEEILTFSDESRFILAHNGWVMNDDPLRNFADSDSNVYLRRELIAWSDSVKLRYGSDPSHCPFLWEIMKNYAEKTAEIFHGLRLDNCHSTPIHVAEYLLDAARNIRHDLYVVAELFTNSDRTDNIFVNRLGITSLIREAMSAWDSHEQGRLVHRYGGLPVGAFKQECVRPLVPSIAHALFMDQTHDNPSPIEKRSVYDILPTAGLVSMACCATGSNRGLDELVPHHIHVVHESRMYSSWTDLAEIKPGLVNNTSGIISAKSALNKLHAKLGEDGFTEVFVDQMEHDIVAVTRHHPKTHVRVVLVAYTAFANPDVHFHRSGGIKDLNFEGDLQDVILEACLRPNNKANGNYPRPSEFVKDDNFINSLINYQCILRESFPVTESNFVRLEGRCVKFVDFQPGSVIVFKINPPASVNGAISSLNNLLSKSSLESVTSSLTLNDFNRVLYRCEEEERDEFGTGAYNIPNFGSFVYCGLQGIVSVLADVRLKNDTGHPLCGNLREGNWLIDYTAARLMKDDCTKKVGELFQKISNLINQFPRYLVPAYFDLALRRVYISCLESAWEKMSSFIKSGSAFTKSLALGSIQCCGISKSGPLPWLSPRLAAPRPGIRTIDGQELQDCPSLCAGLTHFSTGYMRNWGRDCFISLPGLLIVTGRYEEARYHILAFASVLRHGLIPNLLDRGTNSRFNCRDATWFWLQAIKVYVQTVPYGEAILKDRVSRMWPNDFGDVVLDHTVEQSLEDVMQEAVQKHFQGINFRERNAGSKIDAHMSDEGFNVVAGIDPETGFVYGGNAWNCGTWMDKMGSSEKAGNKGVPATPRDGSAVELVGLCASVLKFLTEMYAAGKYRYNSVDKQESQDGKKICWTFADWYSKIKDNFEAKFWIPENPGEKVDPLEHLINRRGIYKDSVGASAPYCDYQFRPNFLVAMTVAPELFNVKNAQIALERCQSILLSELGIRTLDPSDWNYNGNYDNSNDSSDRKLAHGFNYHNGPEWLWPVGFYLRAYLKFSSKLGQTDIALKHVRQVLARQWNYLQLSPWKGLPELTNKDGAECWGSCRVQAWSMATMLEVMKDLEDVAPPIPKN